MTDARGRRVVDDIDTAVRAIPGVTTLFPSLGVGAKLVDAGARLLGIREADASPIRWDETDEGTRVEIAIGVHAAAGAVETSQRVHATVRELCAEKDITLAEVQVTVVHIDDGPQAAPEAG